MVAAPVAVAPVNEVDISIHIRLIENNSAVTACCVLSPGQDKVCIVRLCAILPRSYPYFLLLISSDSQQSESKQDSFYHKFMLSLSSNFSYHAWIHIFTIGGALLSSLGILFLD